jgi:hypothetical protein
MEIGMLGMGDRYPLSTVRNFLGFVLKEMAFQERGKIA